MRIASVKLDAPTGIIMNSCCVHYIQEILTSYKKIYHCQTVTSVATAINNIERWNRQNYLLISSLQNFRATVYNNETNHICKVSVQWHSLFSGTSSAHCKTHSKNCIGAKLSLNNLFFFKKKKRFSWKKDSLPCFLFRQVLSKNHQFLFVWSHPFPPTRILRTADKIQPRKCRTSSAPTQSHTKSHSITHQKPHNP